MTATKRTATVPLALSLALLAGCSVARPWSFSGQSVRETAAAPADTQAWIGKTLPELAAKLGTPTSVEPLQETAGNLVIYSRPGEHYVFETGPNGKIVSASSGS